jgi:hypothetical protein
LELIEGADQGYASDRAISKLGRQITAKGTHIADGLFVSEVETMSLSIWFYLYSVQLWRQWIRLWIIIFSCDILLASTLANASNHFIFNTLFF